MRPVRPAGDQGHFGIRRHFRRRNPVAAREELKAQYARNTSATPRSRPRFEHGRKYRSGRPQPRLHAKRWSDMLGGATDPLQARRPQPHRRPQDQLNPDLTRRFWRSARQTAGDIAETGAGQHGIATATIAARYGLECASFYMGSGRQARQEQKNVA